MGSDDESWCPRCGAYNDLRALDRAESEGWCADCNADVAIGIEECPNCHITLGAEYWESFVAQYGQYLAAMPGIDEEEEWDDFLLERRIMLDRMICCDQDELSCRCTQKIYGDSGFLEDPYDIYVPLSECMGCRNYRQPTCKPLRRFLYQRNRGLAQQKVKPCEDFVLRDPMRPSMIPDYIKEWW